MKSFYLRLRQAGINAAAVLSALLVEDEPPVYSSVEDFVARASTKERTVVEIIHHHQQIRHQQSNPLQWDPITGKCTINTRPPGAPIHAGTGPTKFVIYSEFITLSKYMESVSSFVAKPLPFTYTIEGAASTRHHFLKLEWKYTVGESPDKNSGRLQEQNGYHCPSTLECGDDRHQLGLSKHLDYYGKGDCVISDIGHRLTGRI
jgi:hypothetical protein